MENGKTITFTSEELFGLRVVIFAACGTNGLLDRDADIMNAASEAVIKIGYDGTLPNGVMNVTALPVDD